MDKETSLAGGKMAIAAGGTFWYSITLEQWVAVVTILFVLMQIIVLMPKFISVVRGWWDYWFDDDIEPQPPAGGVA